MNSIPQIIDQHVEEISFLWSIREDAVDAPHYSLGNLARLDGRLDAHLDGLRIAGEAGWGSCREALRQNEAGEVFAASVLAFESGVAARIQAIVEVIQNSPELSSGVISALGWLSFPQAAQHIEQFLASDSPALRRIGIAAAAIHRQPPGRALSEALADDDSLLRARALRAAGELGRVELATQLQSHLAASDEASRLAAAWSLALLTGDAQAIEVLQAMAESPSPEQEKALAMALRRMPLAAGHVSRTKLAQQSATLRLAVIGAGVLGDPIAIPWLLEQMTIPVVARVAGEAFELISGADIAYEDLDGASPEGFEAGPTEEPADENVAMDPDENLPWPDATKVQAWWNARQEALQPGTRYLLGKELRQDWLQEVLRTGRQRQRAAAALELAIQQPGQPLFEVRAPGFRQQALLGTIR